MAEPELNKMELFKKPKDSQMDEEKLKLLRSVDNLQSCFDNLGERRIQYCTFKEELRKMRKLLDLEQRDLLRLVVACIGASKNIEAENLDLQKLEAFRRVIEEIREDIDGSTVNSLLSVLISAGLNPVPDLKYYKPIQV